MKNEMQSQKITHKIAVLSNHLQLHKNINQTILEIDNTRKKQINKYDYLLLPFPF